MTAYAELAQRGLGTCPLEAVLPGSIALRQASTAAHLSVLREAVGMQAPMVTAP
jgi:hypothetical protein